jgi:hypothetical protein
MAKINDQFIRALRVPESKSEVQEFDDNVVGEARKAQQEAKKAKTLGELVGPYLVLREKGNEFRKAMRPKSHVETTRYLERSWQPLHDKPVITVFLMQRLDVGHQCTLARWPSHRAQKAPPARDWLTQRRSPTHNLVPPFPDHLPRDFGDAALVPADVVHDRLDNVRLGKSQLVGRS